LPRSRHYRLTLGDALSAHEDAMTRGGHPGIQSLNLIDAAISRPYQGYYRSLARKCAALIQSMAGNHGFVDGNKRTTLILVNLLLAKSRHRIGGADIAQQNIDLENLILNAVQHTVTFDEVVAWFQVRIEAVPNERRR
jgi:death on curing protein